MKRVFVSFYPYWKEYNERAHTLKNADWLIYGGAGEVGDNILFLRQIVELGVAQKLGINTAALNQSVVIKTDVFRKLVGHVYINMKKIVIRAGYGYSQQSDQLRCSCRHYRSGSVLCHQCKISY